MNRKQAPSILVGIAATLIVGALWHGPLGAGDRLAAALVSDARSFLTRMEAPPVTVTIHRSPLARTLHLAGQGDDFQRGEMVRLLEQRPGVEAATWRRRAEGVWPLLLEAELLGLAGFAVGMILAKLFGLRRYAHRYDPF